MPVKLIINIGKNLVKSRYSFKGIFGERYRRIAVNSNGHSTTIR